MENRREQLVLQNMLFAKKLVYEKKKVLPKFVDEEELLSAAYVGLVEAASRYNFDMNISFTTFAYPRVHGAIYDYLRQSCAQHKNSLSLDSTFTQDGEQTIGDILAARPVRNTDLFDMISAEFGEQAKDVLHLYFVERFSMKEIGKKFGVSEGRISQLIKQYKRDIKSAWSARDLYDLAA